MTGQAAVELQARLQRALAELGMSLSDLMDAAEEVVVFGSRASGDETQESDWDVMCVGLRESQRLPGLDLVWVSPERRDSTEWLESELAHHVAEYGVWLKGSGAWRSAARAGPSAVAAKVRRLRARLTALLRHGPRLSARQRDQHVRALRRDLQRLNAMLRGRAVPPTPVLDREYAAGVTTRAELRRSAKKCQLPPPLLDEPQPARDER